MESSIQNALEEGSVVKDLIDTIQFIERMPPISTSGIYGKLGELVKKYKGSKLKIYRNIKEEHEYFKNIIGTNKEPGVANDVGVITNLKKILGEYEPTLV